ncbi:MAG: DUF481 domain-containing protein [Pseudomonadota bacterium]
MLRTRHPMFVVVVSLCILTALPARASQETDTNTDEAFLENARAALTAVNSAQDDYLSQSVLDAYIQVRPDLQERLTELYFSIVDVAEAEEAAEEAAALQPPGFFSAFGGWTGDANAGFEVETGNTEEVELDVGYDVTRMFGAWELDNLAQLNFTEASEVRIQEEYRARLDARRTYGDRWSLENFIDAERDLFSGFDYRIAVGVGPGYRILRSDQLRWRVTLGPGVRFDKREDESTVDVNPVLSATSAFRWKPTSTLTFGNDIESTFGDGQVISVLSFGETNVFGRLKARLSYDVDINSDAPAPAETTDTTTLLSLVYKIGGGN